MSVIHILAVDDSETFLRGIESLLARESDLQVVDAAQCGATAVEKAKTLRPHVLLADLRLSWEGRGERPTQETGLRMIRRINQIDPQVKVLVLSGSSERRWVVQAMNAGAQGYLAKESSGEQIIRGIRVVAAGGIALTAEQLAWLRQPGEQLTQREMEVLMFLAEGKSDAEIGRALYIATRTASKHVENIRDKLGAGSRWEAVVVARRLGLI